jgi:hypothetical protein
MDLFTVHPDSVNDMWPLIQPHLLQFEQSIGTASAEEIRLQAIDGQAQIWGVATPDGVRGVCITRIHETPRNKFCSIWAAIGNEVFQDILKVYAEIEKWALDNGCTAMEISGRRGWMRVLPGYKEAAVVMHKDLIGVRH